MLDAWQLLAGLGLFLLGMDYIERGLKGLGNDVLVRVLRGSTGRAWTGVLVGAAATALMQSSSLVGLLVLAFVGAGIMPMKNALGVVVGTHVGTTVTGWIVATVGFKLDMGALSLPLLGLGGLGVAMLAEHNRPGAAARLLLGFGLLLSGLGFMKEGVETFASTVDMVWLADYPVAIFAVVGLVLATLLQSSSATMMISLSALHAGVITLPMGAAITIGAHIGTTSTMALGALRGDAASRRVAVFNVIYSTATAVFALLVLLPFVAPMQAWLGIEDPLYSLVAFHTLFTLLGVLMFYPLLGYAAPLLEKYVAGRRNQVSQFVSKVPPSISEAAVAGLEKETLHALGRAMQLTASAFGGRTGQALRPASVPRRRLTGAPGFLDEYQALKNLEGEILTFITAMQTSELSSAQAERVSALAAATRDAVYASKAVKDVRSNLDDMRLRTATSAWVSDLSAHVLSTLNTLETLLIGKMGLSGHEAPHSGVSANTLAALTERHSDTMRQLLMQLQQRGWQGLLHSTALNVIRELDQNLIGLIRAVQACMNTESSPDVEPVDTEIQG
ncbi:Na/Pi symporter [Alcanivorax sp. JB21]|uniref:Na/Pi cotransporter family protein n=1 Tax=Alcanivorax limicola TaxID=2874102 RepID=UPI001CC07B74|nr:Na/Pi symporter [Alcanivorax limicola]MBZ2187489.1 Na/Pi symporter [Alcanivorax limicola]